MKKLILTIMSTCIIISNQTYAITQHTPAITTQFTVPPKALVASVPYIFQISKLGSSGEKSGDAEFYSKNPVRTTSQGYTIYKSLQITPNFTTICHNGSKSTLCFLNNRNNPMPNLLLNLSYQACKYGNYTPKTYPLVVNGKSVGPITIPGAIIKNKIPYPWHNDGSYLGQICPGRRDVASTPASGKLLAYITDGPEPPAGSYHASLTLTVTEVNNHF